MLLLALACETGSITLDPDTAAPILEDDEDTGFIEDEPEGPSNALADAITEDRLMGHLEALQSIADNTNNTRAWTTDGHLDSVDYVVGQLEGAGYDVQESLFTVEDWTLTDTAVSVGQDELDFAAFDGTGIGTVSGPLVAVDLMLPPGAENSSTSGCQASDFDAFPEGGVALIQRGSCTFAEKALNAEAAGAVGVIIFNEGQPGRQGIVEGYIGDPVGVPVVGISFADGERLAGELEGGADLIAALTIEGEVVEYELRNVVAEWPGEQEDWILVGAHLDSVLAGPGINDNGSGSALILEMALQIATLGLEPEKTLRFAWWDGEEYGLLGSIEYGEDLDPEELDSLQAYLNYDMVASTNGAPFLYDGDGSNKGLDFGGAPAPEGSAAIEHLTQDWFDGRELQYTEVSVDIPSDSYWFLYNDVPLGGAFSGASSTKTVREAEVFGGTAGSPYDDCYHQRCDDIENIDQELFINLGQSAGYLLGELMMTTDPLQ